MLQSSFLLFTLNHFLTSDFDQESFTKHKINSEQPIIYAEKNIFWEKPIIIFPGKLEGKEENHQKPCFSLNSHLSLFPLPHAALFLCFPLFPSPNFSGISSESTRNIKKHKTHLGFSSISPKFSWVTLNQPEMLKYKNTQLGILLNFPKFPYLP